MGLPRPCQGGILRPRTNTHLGALLPIPAKFCYILLRMANHPPFETPCKLCLGLGHLPTGEQLRDARISGDLTIDELVRLGKEVGLGSSVSELSEIEREQRGRRINPKIIALYAHGLRWAEEELEPFRRLIPASTEEKETPDA